MFFIAWWTGRGFWTVVIAVAAFILAGAAATALNLQSDQWPFGVALLIAAVINWRLGLKFNRKSRAKVRSLRRRDYLFYRARNKIFSIPMETFSIALAGLGVGLLILGLVAVIRA